MHQALMEHSHVNVSLEPFGIQPTQHVSLIVLLLVTLIQHLQILTQPAVNAMQGTPGVFHIQNALKTV